MALKAHADTFAAIEGPSERPPMKRSCGGFCWAASSDLVRRGEGVSDITINKGPTPWPALR
jgi:hypothetical protein